MANLYLLSRKAFVMCYCFRGQIKTFFFDACQIVRPPLVSGPPNRRKPYNKHLISLVFSVRNLQYGPKTRLIRGIYTSATSGRSTELKLGGENTISTEIGCEIVRLTTKSWDLERLIDALKIPFLSRFSLVLPRFAVHARSSRNANFDKIINSPREELSKETCTDYVKPRFTLIWFLLA